MISLAAVPRHVLAGNGAEFTFRQLDITRGRTKFVSSKLPVAGSDTFTSRRRELLPNVATAESSFLE
jgi:hypothetical protein